MARGPNIDREQLRREVLNCCQELIVAEGVAAVSARRIAGRIGCALGSLYNVYEGIDAVIMEVNGLTLDEIARQVQETVAKGQPPVATMLELGNRYVAYSHDHYHLWSTLLEYPRQQGLVLPAWYQVKVDRIFAIIADIILPLVAGDRDRADMAGKVLWSGFHGISALAIRGRLSSVRTEAAQVMVASLVRHYLAGLQASHGEASPPAPRG